jgi:hypothetical protein
MNSTIEPSAALPPMTRPGALPTLSRPGALQPSSRTGDLPNSAPGALPTTPGRATS